MAKRAGQNLNAESMVYLDWNLMDRGRIDLGLSWVKLCDNAGVKWNTIKQIKDGAAVNPTTAMPVARELRSKVTDLLSSDDPRYIPPPIPQNLTPASSEWTALENTSHGRRASNGLYYVTYQLMHRYTAKRQGRGKFYAPLLSSDSKVQELHNQFARHASICSLVGNHRNITLNLSSTPVNENGGWWVIDEWVGTRTLADCLQAGPWSESPLPVLLLDLARGLQELHKAGVIFRELAPSRVLISDLDSRAVLTDFELGQLLDGSPSVSSDWPEDPYRAPEVDGQKAKPQSDFYSLGKVAVAAAAGAIAETRPPKIILEGAGVPKQVCAFLLDCLKIVPAQRPKKLEPLVKELTLWAEKTK